MSTRVGRRPDGGGPILISDAASMTTTMNTPFGKAWRIAARRAAPLLCAALLWLPQNAAAQDRGSAQSGAAAAARPSGRSEDAGQGIVRPQDRRRRNGQRASIGFYSKGCLAGAVALPINGATWQVMRLSRNRNWGHPKPGRSSWSSSPPKAPKRSAGRACWSATCRSRAAARCVTGHASHQVGLDADIWLTPMPDRELTRAGARGNVRDHGRRRQTAPTSTRKSGRRRIST